MKSEISVTRGRGGFTLLELAATLAILAITTAVAAHQLAGQRHRAARERSDRMLDELAAGAE
ncbi:MAG: type II secretion system protein, partial [Kiritimatiellae bacterium]|nr:type II secretion system protein [Kiritimatiellia bacterium]